MICKNCGADLREGAKFCEYCGSRVVLESASSQSHYTYADGASASGPSYSATQGSYDSGSSYSAQSVPTGGVLPKYVGFIEAIQRFFENYIRFSGRSTRSEYWYTILALFIAQLAVNLVLGSGNLGQTVIGLVSLGTLVPGLSLMVRRLHDVGRHWTYLFWSFLPFVGAIMILVQMCKASVGDNEFGPCAENAAKYF